MTAYYIFPNCAQDRHEECLVHIPMPEDAPEDFCGGAFCRCECHARKAS